MKKIVITLCLIFSISLLFSQNYEIEWQQCFGGSESDKARDIIEVNNDLFILGGTGSNDGDISYNHGEGDVWLIKTDSIGSIIWEKTYGGSNGETGHRIFANSDNGLYILARTGSNDGDITYNPFPNTTCFWILKLDIEGNIIWEKVVGGNGGDEIFTGTTTNDGGIIAIGCSGSEYGDVSVNYGLYDMWMVKLSSEGEIEWDFTLGTDWQDYGQAIIQTNDGGFLVGGASKLTGGGNLDCECHGEADGVLVKLDGDRNIEWQQCYGGSDYDPGIWKILEIEDGYLIVAGAGSNDGDISGWHGENDIWAIKIDFNGNIIWQNSLGGSRFEYSANVFQDSDGGFRIIGMTQSNDGDVSGNHTLSEYNHDIWMMKLSSEGELLWQQCIGGIGDERLNFAVVQKSDYNYVIAGQSDYGPSYDVECTPHGGNGDEDYWVFEIIDTTVGIQQTHLYNILKVYPNPANNYVIFELPVISNPLVVISNPLVVISRETTVRSDEKSPQHNPQSLPQITITNTLGQQVAQIEVKGTKTVLDTRAIQSGVYFYFLEVEGKRYCGKVVVQK